MRPRIPYLENCLDLRVNYATKDLKEKKKTLKKGGYSDDELQKEFIKGREKRRHARKRC
jgi:hypothetical protein